MNPPHLARFVTSERTKSNEQLPGINDITENKLHLFSSHLNFSFLLHIRLREARPGFPTPLRPVFRADSSPFRVTPHKVNDSSVFTSRGSPLFLSLIHNPSCRVFRRASPSSLSHLSSPVFFLTLSFHYGISQEIPNSPGPCWGGEALGRLGRRRLSPRAVMPGWPSSSVHCRIHGLYRQIRGASPRLAPSPSTPAHNPLPYPARALVRKGYSWGQLCEGAPRL